MASVFQVQQDGFKRWDLFADQMEESAKKSTTQTKPRAERLQRCAVFSEKLLNVAELWSVIVLVTATWVIGWYGNLGSR